MNNAKCLHTYRESLGILSHVCDTTFNLRNPKVVWFQKKQTKTNGSHGQEDGKMLQLRLNHIFRYLREGNELSH